MVTVAAAALLVVGSAPASQAGSGGWQRGPAAGEVGPGWEQAPPALVEVVHRTLTASEGGTSESFGYSVAVDGDTAVVGAPWGASAYVFVRSGAGWVEQAVLTIEPDPFGDFFGASVDVDGDTIVVGAPWRYDHQGWAFVFVRSGTTWTQQAELTGSEIRPLDEFGNSVAVDGDTLVAGTAVFGAAYVFVRSGTEWTQQVRLDSSDITDLRFGWSVALDGDTAMVGAPGYCCSTVARGAAYVFVRAGSDWTEQARLTPSDAVDLSDFGASVAVSGDTAVVGAPYRETSAGAEAGAAYAFDRRGTVWTEHAKLVAPDGAAADYFGFSVALSGRTAVIGSVRGDTEAGIDAGSAYLFGRHKTAWSHPVKLTAPDGAPGDLFGRSVALSGPALLVGARYDDTSAGIDAGSAHLYAVRQQ